MPKVVTPLNLDFDEKEEFIKHFGEGSLSKFVRQCIHEKLEEKNREALINLSPVRMALRDSHTITSTVVKESLDKYIEHVNTIEDLKEAAVLEGTSLRFYQSARQRYIFLKRH